MTGISSRDAFLSSAAAPNISGAYLLVCARPGIAKRLADDFLKKLYCKKGGCGTCADCHMVSEGHVDIMRLRAPKVAEFREAISFAAEKPVNRYKCIVIEDADEISISAANSMLKTLEDPPPGTVFILEAKSVSGVPPTIASRCAAVLIPPDRNVESLIIKELGTDKDTARALAYLSAGFAEEAKTLYEDKEFWDARPKALDVCNKLLYQKGMAISAHADFLEANKERIAAVLTVMQSYFRDILVYIKTGDLELIQNADKKAEIVQAAADFTSGAISNIINAILEAERRFSVPVNFRLAAEKLLFDILEEKARWKKS